MDETADYLLRHHGPTVPLSVAAAALGVRESTLRRWMERGILSADDEVRRAELCLLARRFRALRAYREAHPQVFAHQLPS